jgi:hypothetical protein
LPTPCVLNDIIQVSKKDNYNSCAIYHDCFQKK